jgi:hypothetical protein
VQTPFYSEFKGFWSLVIRWAEDDIDTSPYMKDYSQTIALLEVEREEEIGSVLNEVHELSKAHHPHPLLLPICLLEKHIEESIKQFTDITRRVAQVERELHQDMIIPPSQGNNDYRMATYQRFNETLHQCSGAVVDLEIRRKFEKELSAHLQKNISTIIESYPNAKLPQYCTDLKERLDLFCSIAGNHDLDIESLPRRIGTQITVLYNQIAQRLAEAARRDNIIMTRIAKSSKDDSTAMKTIAILTTVFLPGTFVSVSSFTDSSFKQS